MADPLTCVLFALSREAMFFRRALSSRQVLRGAPCPGWLARVENRRVLVLITGMGAAATERALSWALGGENSLGQPGFVIAAGFCGGLVADARVGVLIQPTEVVEGEGGEARFAAVRRTARSWRCEDASPESCVLTGRLVTVAAPVLTQEERQALHQRCGAVAVDMESATAARLCQEAGIPFTCLRAVSDDGNAPLSPALSSALLGERVNILRLLGAVLYQPFLAVELMRLARQSRTASQALAEGLLPMLGSRMF